MSWGPLAETTFPHLFEPFTLGSLRLKNRFVVAPMTRARAGDSLLPNELIKEYYSQFVSAGLIISEGVHISEQARGWPDVPGLWTKEQTDKWKTVTSAVHKKGGLIFAQLWHQGRASHSSFHGGQPPVAPSEMKWEGLVNNAITKKKEAQNEVPRALTIDEIQQVVKDFASAARNAKEAGFDGVEIHSANGYLLDEFLQSKSNLRTDAYGGSIENRFRIVGQVIDAVVEVFGSDRVGIRFSPNGTLNDMGSTDFRETFSYAILEAGKRELAYVHILDGFVYGFHGLGDAFTLSDARKLLPPSTAVIGNGCYTPELAESRIASGDADMISFGRLFLGNPDLPERVANGWPLAEPPEREWFNMPNDEYPSGKGFIVPRYQPESH